MVTHDRAIAAQADRTVRLAQGASRRGGRTDATSPSAVVSSVGHATRAPCNGLWLRSSDRS